MDPAQLEQNIRKVIESVYGTDVGTFTATVENVYDEKATYIHPLFKVVGRDKIMALEKGMKLLRRGEPRILNVVHNNDTAIVELSQNLLVNPFKEVPILVELKLSDTASGMKKIVSHAEVFTVSGVVSSIPLVGFAYQSVAQPILGQVFTTAMRQFERMKGKATDVASVTMNTVQKETDVIKDYARVLVNKISTPSQTEVVVQAERFHDPSGETEGLEPVPKAQDKTVPYRVSDREE